VGRNRIVLWTDTDLVEAARQGDRVALNELLERNYDLVQTICRRILWRPYHADALEQARQEALLRIARGINRFNGESQLSSWIHRIATNAALDALKRYDRTPHPAIVPEQSAKASTGDAVAIRIRVDQCLEQLSEQYRQPVILCFLCDLDYDEIATRMGVPVGTVKSRIHRGRTALQRCLGEGDVDAEATHLGTIPSDDESHSAVTSALDAGP
jgi:RNA polymerase sigma-70 factor (ECF subfamily)